MAVTGRRAVLHLADYGGAYSGNFVASLRALSGPCDALGLRLAFAFSESKVARPWIDALRAGGTPVHLLRREGSLSERTSAVGRISTEENAAILHSHFGTYDLPATLAAARGGQQVVWHMHSPLDEVRPLHAVAKDAIKLRVFGRSAHAAAVSTAILEEAIRHGFPAARASYIPNGVDLAHATGTSLGRDELRRQFGIAPSQRVMLAFGWDPLRKGIDVILDAAAALARDGGDRLLLLVGTERLHELLAARFGGTLPAWLRTIAPQQHVGDLYAAADAFVSASRVEGFPYALGEALANGLPSVVSDIPGVEWAREVGAARFFTSGDAASLADGLRDVTSWTAAEIAPRAAEAKAFARDRLSLSAWAGRVAQVYRTALEMA